MQIMLVGWFAVGLLAGAVVAWLIGNARLASERGIAQERIAARERELQALVSAAEESLRQRKEDEQTLKDSFAALAASALDANSRRLTDMAKTELTNQQKEAANKLTEKETAIKTLLEPMQASLAALSTHSQDLEVKREGAYQAVLAEVQNIQRSHTDLRKETTQLVAALRAPKARGNWGELQLKKCVEFAGMVQYASFDVERFVRGEDASYRPDLVVKMPNGRTIVVDAKTPLDAFLDASSAEDEVVRTGKLAAHAARVREHLKDLSSKGYWRQFVDSPDFVVCFLPSEVLFSAALEQDPSLIEFSASSGVLLATPTTLIALLKAVAFGWQQSEIARNADAIRDTALSVYGKLAGLHNDFVNLGKRLMAAGSAYDDMLTKVEGRGGIFSVSRKLRELGIGEEQISELKPVGMTLKPMEAEDWQPGLTLAADAEDSTQ
jgi:DNA recombination protein RmuC